MNFYITEDDLDYEDELLRNPFQLKSWLRYISYKKAHNAPMEAICHLYERALLELPRSYKLWKMYLDIRIGLCNETVWPLDEKYELVNYCFERALIFLNTMPRIWTDYAEFLLKQGKITKTRRTLDRALKALPITQHDRIWDIYLKFIKKFNIPELSLRVYSRYLKLYPEKVEDYVEYLKSISRYDEAASQLVKILNNHRFKSAKGRTRYSLWMELCDIVSQHPKEIKTVSVELILRAGISRFSDQVGRLWISLAEYFIHMGNLLKARDVFEEGIKSVITVRDFSQIFDAYAKFEEAILANLMSNMELENEEEDETVDIDLRMAFFEKLMERRPFHLSDVVLKQNPHNVSEWMKRVDLCGDNEPLIIETYERAISKIQPKRAHGDLHTLWIKYAMFFAAKDNVKECRAVFDRATQVDFRSVENLADVWIAYSNMELDKGDNHRAIEVMTKATKPARGTRVDLLDDRIPVQHRLFKNAKLWQHYIDLEEALGTVESTKAVYERVLELKIATPQVFINFALFLQLHKYFEESFKVYERGIDTFGYPIAFEIWNVYLPKFIQRYGSTKLERTRDLFEQALEKCPENYCKIIYLMYAKFEEEHGLIRQALRIYDRATKAVTKSNEKKDIFKIYIAKVTESFGVTNAREVYEKAISMLASDDAREMCHEFAELERSLGEIDRARALYAYGSQFCDPKRVSTYWKAWHDFEVAHGNEDTYREMLRIKRSVQATFDAKVTLGSVLLPKQAEGEILQGFVPSSSNQNKEEEREEMDVQLEPEGNTSVEPEEPVITEEPTVPPVIEAPPKLGAKERLMALKKSK